MADKWDWGDEGEFSDVEYGEENELLPLNSSKPKRSKVGHNAPDLQFRQIKNVFSTREEDTKYRHAVLSILFGGVVLILIITLGIAIHTRQTYPQKIGSLPRPSVNNYNETIKPTEQTNKNIQTAKTSTTQQDVLCPDFRWNKYRLPRVVIPSLYQIHLEPSMKTDNYSAQLDITVEVKEETDFIVMHSVGHNITAVFLEQKNGDVKTRINVTAVTECAAVGFIALELHHKISAELSYVIHIEFNANFSNGLNGLYLSTYKDQNEHDVHIATTQLEPLYARKVFPCFDEPNFKANFSLNVTSDGSHKILFNTPLKKSTILPNKMVTEEFETTPTMSTYLFAIIISNFECKTKTVTSKLSKKNITVSVYSEPERVDETQFALNVTCRILQFFEERFKIPYPLKKLDIVAIPDFSAGAMENWGLITFRERVLINEKSSDSEKQYVATTITHEVSHQWFGNLVTMDWWNDLWLNEGFAAYMEIYGSDHLFPEWKQMDKFCISRMEKAMSTDKSSHSHPITFPVDSDDSIELMFDSITYSKGASVISMVLQSVGEEKFFQAVTNYLNKHAYGNTVNSDLLNEIISIGEGKLDDLKESFNSWITKPGFPIIDVTVDENNKKLQLTQSRYFEQGSEVITNDDATWVIPLSYITDSSTTEATIVNFNDKTMTLEYSGKWIKFNYDRTGYYIVNYDDKLFSKLSEALMLDHTTFTARDRSDIIISADYSARAGKMNYGLLLDMLKYIANDRDFLPVTDAIGVLERIGDLLSTFDPAAHLKYKRYMFELLTPLYEDLAWKNDSMLDDNYLLVQLKNSIMAFMCLENYQPCVNKALETFDQMKNDKIVIDGNEKSTVLTTAIKYGGEDNWDYLWMKYKDVSTVNKRSILAALCHTPIVDKLQEILINALKGDIIRQQDFGTVYKSMTVTNAGRTQAREFFIDNIKEIKDKFATSSFEMWHAIPVLSGTLTNENDLNEMTELLKSNDLLDNNLLAKQMLEKAKVNLAWDRDLRNDVVEWLNQNVEE